MKNSSNDRSHSYHSKVLNSLLTNIPSIVEHAEFSGMFARYFKSSTLRKSLSRRLHCSPNRLLRSGVVVIAVNCPSFERGRKSSSRRAIDQRRYGEDLHSYGRSSSSGGHWSTLRTTTAHEPMAQSWEGCCLRSLCPVFRSCIDERLSEHRT